MITFNDKEDSVDCLITSQRILSTDYNLQIDCLNVLFVNELLEYYESLFLEINWLFLKTSTKDPRDKK